MGLFNIFPLKAVGTSRVVVAGSFVTHGTTPTVHSGAGFSVARVADGRYTVTLSQSPYEIESVVVSVAPETIATPSIVQVDQDTIDNNSFEVRLLQEGVAVFALADDAGSEIHFIAVCRNSSVDN
jgi:hypothetical protein